MTHPLDTFEEDMEKVVAAATLIIASIRDDDLRDKAKRLLREVKADAQHPSAIDALDGFLCVLAPGGAR